MRVELSSIVLRAITCNSCYILVGRKNGGTNKLTLGYKNSVYLSVSRSTFLVRSHTFRRSHW